MPRATRTSLPTATVGQRHPPAPAGAQPHPDGAGASDWHTAVRPVAHGEGRVPGFPRRALPPPAGVRDVPRRVLRRSGAAGLDFARSRPARIVSSHCRAKSNSEVVEFVEFKRSKHEERENVMGASERYLRLTQLAQRAFTGGRLERSLRLFDAAEDEARRLGDRELSDRAFCNRCVVLLELERLDGAVGELKHVLMRSRDPFTSWMAAYYTAQVYEAEGNIARALAYARRASELAGSVRRAPRPQRLGQPARRARAEGLPLRGGRGELPRRRSRSLPRTVTTRSTWPIIARQPRVLPDVHRRAGRGHRAVPRRRRDPRGARQRAAPPRGLPGPLLRHAAARASSSRPASCGEKALALAPRVQLTRRSSATPSCCSPTPRWTQGDEEATDAYLRLAVGLLPRFSRDEGLPPRVQRARGDQPEGVRQTMRRILS